MNKSWSAIIKISLLSILAFGAIVYLTAEKPKSSISSMPNTLSLVGDKKNYNTNAIFKPNTVVAIGNHDSISLVKNIPDLVDLKSKNFVIVTNVSSAPWFVKQYIIPAKLEEIKGNSKIPFVYDSTGEFAIFFKHLNNDKKYYSIHFIDQNLQASKVAEGNVEDGDLDKNLSRDEQISRLAKTLSEISKIEY